MSRRHPAPVAPRREERAGVLSVKELLFDLRPPTFTLLESVKWVAEEDLTFDGECKAEWENKGEAAVKLMLVSCVGRNVIAV